MRGRKVDKKSRPAGRLFHARWKGITSFPGLRQERLQRALRLPGQQPGPARLQPAWQLPEPGQPGRQRPVQQPERLQPAWLLLSCRKRKQPERSEQQRGASFSFGNPLSIKNEYNEPKFIWCDRRARRSARNFSTFCVAGIALCCAAASDAHLTGQAMSNFAVCHLLAESPRSASRTARIPRCR